MVEVSGLVKLGLGGGEFRFRVQGLLKPCEAARVISQGLGFRVSGELAEDGVWGLGFRVLGLFHGA